MSIRHGNLLSQSYRFLQQLPLTLQINRSRKDMVVCADRE